MSLSPVFWMVLGGGECAKVLWYRGGDAEVQTPDGDCGYWEFVVSWEEIPEPGVGPFEYTREAGGGTIYMQGTLAVLLSILPFRVEWEDPPYETTIVSMTLVSPTPEIRQEATMMETPPVDCDDGGDGVLPAREYLDSLDWISVEYEVCIFPELTGDGYGISVRDGSDTEIDLVEYVGTTMEFFATTDPVNPPF